MTRLIATIAVSGAALLLAGCATAQQTATPATAPQSAQEALRPYYATLDAKLPKAPANPAASLPKNSALP